MTIGLCGDYRRTYWRFVYEALRAGQINELIAVSLVAHHMIQFARECTDGRQNASFYADHSKITAEEPAVAA